MSSTVTTPGRSAPGIAGRHVEASGGEALGEVEADRGRFRDHRVAVPDLQQRAGPRDAPDRDQVAGAEQSELDPRPATLGDRRPAGGNVLTHDVAADLPAHPAGASRRGASGGR